MIELSNTLIDRLSPMSTGLFEKHGEATALVQMWRAGSHYVESATVFCFNREETYPPWQVQYVKKALVQCPPECFLQLRASCAPHWHSDSSIAKPLPKPIAHLVSVIPWQQQPVDYGRGSYSILKKEVLWKHMCTTQNHRVSP